MASTLAAKNCSHLVPSGPGREGPTGAKTQRLDYTRRCRHGNVSGRGFDSRRLHLIGFRNPSRSKQGLPVSNWRALLVWCTYSGICEGRRRRPAPNRVTRWPPAKPEKSRTGPRVSKSRDAAPTRHAMQVVGNQRVAETEIFPVWRSRPRGGSHQNRRHDEWDQRVCRASRCWRANLESRATTY